MNLLPSCYRKIVPFIQKKGNVWKEFLRSATITYPEYTLENQPRINYTSLDPKDQNLDHVGMWYTLKPDMAKHLFSTGGLRLKIKELNADIFHETSFMIRQPALEMIDLIKRSNLSATPNRFLFYGRNGAGKTTSLAHVIHYLVKEDYVIAHIAAPVRWFTIYKEILPSVMRDDWFDHTVDASFWLQHFKMQNESLLKNPEMVTQETYSWTQREKTEKGSPILNLIEFGISRSRYASSCVYHLVNELKKLADQRKIKLAFVCDGVNSLYASTSKFLREDKSAVSHEYFTLLQAFAQFFPKDWRGGVILGSVDKIMSTKERRASHYPRYLLGKKGFADLDPFVPIEVPDYSDVEFESAVNYYLAKKWLQHPASASAEGKEELAFITSKNGLELLNRADCH